MSLPDLDPPIWVSWFSIAFDSILAVAMFAAYLPQLLRLRKATTGDKPTFDGFSNYYLYFHALFCNSMLSVSLLTVSTHWENDLVVCAKWMAVVPIFAQWVCAMSLVFTYVVGQPKRFAGDFSYISIIFHAIFFVGFGFLLADAHGWDGLLAGGLGMLVVLSMPVILIVQPYSQYQEMKRMDKFPAFSLRSFKMQAAVVSVLVVSLLVKFDGGPIALFCYSMWLVGAGIVWYRTVYGREEQTESEGDNELGGLLHGGEEPRESEKETGLGVFLD